MNSITAPSRSRSRTRAGPRRRRRGRSRATTAAPAERRRRRSRRSGRAPTPCRLRGPSDVGHEAVADEDRVVGGQREPIQQGVGHVRATACRRWPRRGRRSTPRWRRASPRSPGRSPSAVRAERVGVGGHDPGARTDRAEGGRELGVVERAVPRDHDDVRAWSGRPSPGPGSRTRRRGAGRRAAARRSAGCVVPRAWRSR